MATEFNCRKLLLLFFFSLVFGKNRERLERLLEANVFGGGFDFFFKKDVLQMSQTANKLRMIYVYIVQQMNINSSDVNQRNKNSSHTRFKSEFGL